MLYVAILKVIPVADDMKYWSTPPLALYMKAHVGKIQHFSEGW